MARSDLHTAFIITFLPFAVKGNGNCAAQIPADLIPEIIGFHPATQLPACVAFLIGNESFSIGDALRLMQGGQSAASSLISSLIQERIGRL